VTLSIPSNLPDEVLAAALAYAAEGWYVGPCRMATKDPGSVLGKGWQHQTSRDPHTIAAWFAGTSHGVFLHLGRSGAIAFDVDDPPKLHPAIRLAVEQYRPPFQSTRVGQSGRGHYVFEQPSGRDVGNALGVLGGGWGEIRGRNGVIIVAPSEHQDGGRYLWETSGAVPELPGYVASRLADALAAVDAATDRQVKSFLDTYGKPGSRPDLLGFHLGGYAKKVEAGESRHASLSGPLAGAMREAMAGLLDAREAADTMEAVFLAAVGQVPRSSKQGPPRAGPRALGEYRGLLAWAIGQAVGSDPATTLARIADKVPQQDFVATVPGTQPAQEPQPAVNSAAEGDPAAGGLAEVAFQLRVDETVSRLKVRREAEKRLRAESEPPAPPFDSGTLAELLARPADPPMRAEGLVPWEASALVVAQRKTGKTTLMLNYARALITGETFLGRFAMLPVQGRVTIVNYEVSGAMLGRWADECGIDRERLFVVNLRGRRNPLNVPDDRERLAELLRTMDTETLIVDPFGRAFTGTSQNDSGEVGAFLTDLDRFTRAEVGAKDLVLTAHAGWNGERTRGSSALEDWADVIITMNRDDSDDGDDARFLRAIGRDVDIDEDQLLFDETNRTLSLAGAGSRKQAKRVRAVDALVPVVVRVVQGSPGISTRNLRTAVREAADPSIPFQAADVDKASKRAEDDGKIRIEAGGRGRRSAHHPTVSNRVQSVSETQPSTVSTVSIGDTVTVAHTSTPHDDPESDTVTPDGEEASKAGKGYGQSQDVTCLVCHQRMVIVESGQTTHPTCEVDAHRTDERKTA